MVIGTDGDRGYLGYQICTLKYERPFMYSDNKVLIHTVFTTLICSLFNYVITGWEIVHRT